MGGESDKSLMFVVFDEKLGRKVGLGDLNAEGREGRKTWWGIVLMGSRLGFSAGRQAFLMASLLLLI